MDKVEPTINSSENSSNHLTPKEYEFDFTGSGSEYFRIWIVNILLTILTLGIYSAWAKVRTKRYFYGNTHLAQSSFDYLANPITILKGRLIAMALLIIFIGLRSLNPVFEAFFFLALFLFTPWLIVRSLAFNALNSAYRNIRFNFIGRTGAAAKEYIAFPLLVFFTFGLIFPYIRYRQTRFTVDNHLFGDQHFKFNATSGDYYKLFAIVFVAMIAISIIGFMPMASLGELKDDPEAMMAAMAVYLPFIYIAMGLVGVYAQVKLLNLLFSNVTLADHQFESSLKVGPMLWLHISNLLGIIVTLGLFYPWAKIRMARYRLEQLNFIATTDLNSFTASQPENVSATGDEIGEVFAVDVGF